MKTQIKIKQCYIHCPFYHSSMDGMECTHPYWDDKGPYDNMIITQKNSKDGKFPEECPLKIEPLDIHYSL